MRLTGGLLKTKAILPAIMARAHLYACSHRSGRCLLFFNERGTLLLPLSSVATIILHVSLSGIEEVHETAKLYGFFIIPTPLHTCICHGYFTPIIRKVLFQ